MQWIDRFYESMEVGLNATYGIGPDKDKAWYYDENGEIVFKSGDDLPDEYVRGQQRFRSHRQSSTIPSAISSAIRSRMK